MSEGARGPGNVRSLNDALRKVRIAEADRTDGVVDLQEAERARLDILAEELRSVFAEVPADNDQFILKVAGGPQPRLWIDATSFVMVGRDRRTYRFLKDTRLGRTIVLESNSIDDVADTVTNYVAERIIERERAVEGDWLVKRLARDGAARRGKGAVASDDAAPAFADAVRPADRVRPARPLDGRAAGWVAAGFLGGILIGVVAVLIYAWAGAG
ncbi:MAG: hypothetical protein IT534_12445 [Bauldia sp.]|nr:hypothetical protein [Bauldia sp.]